MEKHFKNFYQQIEKKQCFTVIEFRLRYQKKLYAYLTTHCSTLKEDLISMENHYKLLKKQS